MFLSPTLLTARSHLSSTFPLTPVTLLSVSLPFSTLISHYQRCHVREWVFWGSRGVCLSICKGASWIWDCSLKRIHPNLFHPTHLRGLNATYKAIHLQSSRWEASSVFMVCLSDLWEENRGDLLKHNVAPWWQAWVVYCGCTAEVSLPSAFCAAHFCAPILFTQPVL